MVKKGARIRGYESSGEKNRKEVIIFKTINAMADFIIEQWRIVSEKAIKEKRHSGYQEELNFKKLCKKHCPGVRPNWMMSVMSL
jgi:hypothetical protein